MVREGGGGGEGTHQPYSTEEYSLLLQSLEQSHVEWSGADMCLQI